MEHAASKVNELLGDMHKATLARAIGVDPSPLGKWLNGTGRWKPSVGQLLAIARFFDVSLDYLADDTLDADPTRTAELPEDEARVLEVYRSLKEDPSQGLDAREAMRRLSRPSDAPRKTPPVIRDPDPPARPQRPPRRSGGHGGG